MTTKYDAQSVVRRLHQVGYSLEQTDQTPKLTQLMKDSITLIEQMHADVKVLAEALSHYANERNWENDEHGWARKWLEPDTEFPRSYDGGEIARAALARIQGEAPRPANARPDDGPRCSGCGSTDCNGECAGDDMMGDS